MVNITGMGGQLDRNGWSTCIGLYTRYDKKAILFLREAGATVPDSYQVSVMDYDKPFDTTEVGNTFTVDSNHGITRLDSASINFTWIANDSLQIDYNKNLRTFFKERKIDGVTIFYNER